MTITSPGGSRQGINALKNGVQIGGTTIYTGSGTPTAYATALRIGDLYVDYTNGAMYIASATGLSGWTPFAGLDSVTSMSVTATSVAYNNSALNVGKYGAGLADTLTADNILVSFVNKSGVNKTSADTSSMTLFVGNSTTAAVTNNKMQGILSSMTIAHNMYDAYSVQGHIAVTGNCGTQNANAHVTGISGKASVDTSKTLATGWLTAGLFIIEGAGACTQMCSVVSIVQEAGTNLANPMLYINNDGTATKGIQFVGNFTTGIQIPSMTLGITSAAPISITATSTAYNNSVLNVGKYGTAIADTIVGDNILVSFVNSSGVNKTGADTSSMTLYVGNSTTAAVTNNKLQGVLSSMSIGHNVFDAYAGQFHIAVTATMATQAGNGNLVGLACKANIAGGVTATGNVSALYVVLDTGSGDTATGRYDMIRMENNATNCDSAISFGDTTHMAYLFDMGAAGCVAACTGTTCAGDGYKIKVRIGGADFYIRAASAWT